MPLEYTSFIKRQICRTKNNFEKPILHILADLVWLPEKLLSEEF